MIEVTGHFQNEECPRNGSPYAGGKKSGHGNDDDIRGIHIGEETGRDKNTGFCRSHEGTCNEKGQEESARYTAAVTDESEKVFTQKQKTDESETVSCFCQRVYQCISSAQNLGKTKTENRGGKKGKKNFYRLVFKYGETVKFVGMEKTVVKNDTADTASDGNKNDIDQIFRRKTDQTGKKETCGRAEKETGYNGGRNGSGHGGKKNGARKIPVQLFKGKHHTCHGRIESGGKTGTGTGGNEIPLFHACPSHETAESLCGNGTDLDRRAFPSQRETCTYTGGTCHNLYPEYTEPVHFEKTENDTFDLRNSRA